MFGGIEAGGTKFVCAVAERDAKVIKRINIPTTTPAETLAQVFSFFEPYELESLAVGSFGPIGIDPSRSDYGFVLATPKAGWQQFDFLGTLKKHFDVPIAWTTDVNAAAYGEAQKGAAQGKKHCVYVTVGTGIGGGVLSNGQLFAGALHPEIGHIRVNRHPDDDYQGTCPYHGDCLEGLAAGPALAARAGKPGEELAADDPIWELQAYYLAQALMTYTLTYGPEIIILGGGVMNQEHLVTAIRHAFSETLNGYVGLPPVEEYLVRWGLPNESGIIGTLLLAEEEAHTHKSSSKEDTHIGMKLGE